MKKNKEFNISSGENTKASYVADLIIKLSGKGEKKFYLPEEAQPQKINLDISELKKIGFRPKVSIEEGIKKTFKWYKENFKEIENER